MIIVFYDQTGKEITKNWDEVPAVGELVLVKHQVTTTQRKTYQGWWSTKHEESSTVKDVATIKGRVISRRWEEYGRPPRVFIGVLDPDGSPPTPPETP